MALPTAAAEVPVQADLVKLYISHFSVEGSL
jgi:hypothetical protein